MAARAHDESPAADAVPADFDPDNSFSLIISPDEMRGLDADLGIVDPDELAASLTEAGLDQAQVTALQARDLSLTTYARLVEMEVADLRRQGIEALDPDITTDPDGTRLPGYGYPAEVPGMSEAEVTYRAVSCQNRFTGAYQLLYRAAVQSQQPHS
ncbi:hypothetical protein GCM10027586_02230 [Kineococcus gypseus]|uniref:hypothetical protein n=1 Tax=Kineococcus gypseus TaxID=1637102 RepID=UPI003D7D0965